MKGTKSQDKLSAKGKSSSKLLKIKPSQIQQKSKDASALPKQIVRFKKVESSSHLIPEIKSTQATERQNVTTLKLKPLSISRISKALQDKNLRSVVTTAMQTKKNSIAAASNPQTGQQPYPLKSVPIKFREPVKQAAHKVPETKLEPSFALKVNPSSLKIKNFNEFLKKKDQLFQSEQVNKT